MRKPHEWIIGASAGCDVVVEEPTVSGRHCRLLWQEGVYQLEDLGSTNGTFVNDVQLTRPSTVTRDDRITLGKSVPFPWSQVQQPVGGRHKRLRLGRTGRLPTRWLRRSVLVAAPAHSSVRRRSTHRAGPGYRSAARWWYRHRHVGRVDGRSRVTDPTAAATPGKVDAVVGRAGVLPQLVGETEIACHRATAASPTTQTR